VPAPRPILDERWSLARAFSATPGTLTVTGGVLLAVLLVLGWLLGRTGRDRQPSGMAPLAGEVVEYAPPAGIRPAQAGLLVDEVVKPVALTATLVDLAVRGYLRIEELPDHPGKGSDWRLVKLKAPDEDLLGYERVLVDGLFGTRRRVDAEDLEAVQLSDLDDWRYADRFERVRMWLYRDVVQRRWFSQRPDKVRRSWLGRGLVVTVVGAVLLGLLVWQTHFGLAAIPILLAGLVLMVGARRMPSRTPVGAGLLRRVRAFRGYLEAGGVDHSGPAQAAEQFSPYLPYAMVFGLSEQWARTFAVVGAPPPIPWYGGRDPYSWHRFPSRIDEFASSAAATLSAPPAAVSGSSGFGGGGGSSGGGSSGGGGGGGGGSSW
jgi:uncharacterized membrane protein YgcG